MIYTEYKNLGEWCKEANIEIIDSVGAWEQYGLSVINNETIAFISKKEEYYEKVYRLLPLLEKMYVLNYFDALDDYGEYMIKRVIKPEGCVSNEFTDWREAMVLLEQYDTDMVKETIDKAPIHPDFAPVFQRRNNWEIKYGNICHRCWKDNSGWDFMEFVFGRFGFGLIEKEYLSKHKSILFRRFK